jgi:hypothetical protein
MKKSQILGITIIAVIVLSCSVKPKDDTIDNSIQFFEKITKDNGIWVHQPEDTTFGFDTFLTKFQMKAGDTLNGLITGLTKAGDTVLFWKVKEYKDPEIDSIIFEQKGQIGSVRNTSFFPDPGIRKANFEIVYSNGARERHKDTHTLLNDSTMLMESALFDAENQKWIKQPEAVWYRRKN